MFNFYNEDGKPNTDMVKVNELNDLVYREFSFSDKPGEKEHVPPIVVTSSSFTRENYGNELMDDLRMRLGVTNGYDDSINFIISTIMNPWLSHTVKGSFIPELMSIMIKNLKIMVAKVKTEAIPVA